MSDDVRIVVRADDLTGPGFGSVNRGLRQLQRTADGRLRDMRGRFVSESALISGALNNVTGSISGGGGAGGPGLQAAMIGVAAAAGLTLLPALGALSPMLFGVAAAGGAAALAMKDIKEEAKKLKPEFETWQKTASKAVMPGVTAAVKDLKVAMKDLNPVIKVGGQAFGEFAREAGKFAKSPAFQGALLKNVQLGSEFFKSFTRSILSFTQAFLDFGAKSKPTLDSFTRGLGGLLDTGLPGMFKGLERGIQGSSQMLNGFFGLLNDKLLPALGRLAGEVARQTGPVFEQLFKLFGTFGAGAMDLVVGGLRLLKPVFEDITFGLKSVNQWIEIIGPTLRDMGLAVLGAFAPVGEEIDKVKGPFQRLSEAIEENKRILLEGARFGANAVLDLVEAGIANLPSLIGAFRDLSFVVLMALDAIVSGAAAAFGWIPDIGPKLKAANAEFDQFRTRYLVALDIAESRARTFAANTTPLLERGRLKMNINNWTTQIATAKAKLKTVPPERRAALKANIADLERKVASARAQLNSLNGKTAHVWVVTHFEARREGSHGTQLGYAHGGIIGAAGGGPRSRMTLVGEQGPELVDLAPGSRVRSNPDTRRMLSPAGAGAASEPLHITLVIGDKKLGEVVIDPLRKAVAARGGNVQAVLGKRGG